MNNYQHPPLFSFDELTVPQTIGRVLKIVSSQWLNFIQLGLATVLPFFFVYLGGTFAFWSLMIKGLDEMGKDEDNSDWSDFQMVIVESIVGLTMIVLVTVVLSVVVSIVGQAAMVRATAELYAHNRMPDASVSLQKGLWQFCELFLAGLLLQILMVFVVSLPVILMVHGMMLLGILLSLIVPFLALYMNIRFTLVYPAIVVEESCTASGGLKRSWELTQGAFCDIWCAKTAFAALFGLVLYVNMHLLIYSGEHDNEKASIALFLIMTSLPNFFFTPCSNVLQTVLYMNRRIRTEGLTQGALAQDLVDRRATGDLTQPLLTVTEAHAELDDGTNAIANPVTTTLDIEPLAVEAPKVDTVPAADVDQVV